MAEEIAILVKSIKKTTMERKDKTGTFDAFEIQDSSNNTYTGGEWLIPSTLKEGDQVKVSYQALAKKDGSTVRKLLTVGNIDTTEQFAKQLKNQVKAQFTTNSSFDSKGARVGGAYHDAVQLAMHNSGKNPVSVSIVETFANELLQAMNRSQNNA